LGDKWCLGGTPIHSFGHVTWPLTCSSNPFPFISG
jgi:hypothetical protein